MTTTQRPRPQRPTAPAPNPASRGLILVAVAVVLGAILLIKGGGIGFDQDGEELTIDTGGDSTASCTASPETTAATLAGEVCADDRSPATDEPAALPAVAPACGMVSLRAMLACGGILAGWSAAMISLPAPAIVRVELVDSIVGLLVVADDVAISVSPTLDVPPPRA